MRVEFYQTLDETVDLKDGLIPSEKTDVKQTRYCIVEADMIYIGKDGCVHIETSRGKKFVSLIDVDGIEGYEAKVNWSRMAIAQADGAGSGKSFRFTNSFVEVVADSFVS